MNERIEKTLLALKKNNMESYYCETGAKAKELALSLIPDGSTVAIGGSVTVSSLGILDELRKGDYNFIDRHAAKTSEEQKEVFRKSFFADAYICSTNAITVSGELYNVDGVGNRVACMLYGPESVIIVSGVNKIVDNIDEAALRVKAIAGPLNCKRLNKNTYCQKTGKCVAFSGGKENELTAACMSPDRICRDYVVMAQQVQKGRVKVILVDEELGY